MILIDSLYINKSGGFRLLEYLVDRLNAESIDFYLLADSRCYSKFDSCKNVRYMKASLWARKKFYLENGKRFSAVLCFGNIPAPLKLDVPVYTYFHHINLLTLSETEGILSRVLSWLKREVYRYYKNNTNYWLVQTSNTANELVRHLGETPERVKIMPFFELPEKLYALKNETHGDDYVYISIYVPGKGHDELLEAWKILHHRGIDKKLHLTVPFDCHSFVDKIKEAQENGVNVVNHGLIPFEQVIDLYRQSKAIVYPSHNESLGLGIVEALEAGCDVIAPDLPYIHSICKPSRVFNPTSAISIAEAIISYEKGQDPKSVLIIRSMVSELLDMLDGKIDKC